MPRPFEQATEEDLVNEFLSDPRAKMAPTTFHMDSLLREMQEIEGARHRQPPQRGQRYMIEINIIMFFFLYNKTNYLIM